ncbi:MAG: hypothetical protein IK109_04295 [Clostridiales bacterium]|nr:hypothetical protein [Clostridiales bacterium]MBR5417240.1 hypothetical protein [Clostridiales bacterium]
MKNSGGKDTFLLFLVLILALGAVCYLCIIKKNLDKLNTVKEELSQVEQEKAMNDAIIQQAEQLDAQREELKNQLQTLENKLLPELYTSAIQRKLFKHFEDAGIPFIVEVSNTPLEYELVNMTDGKVSPNRVMSSRYTIRVSGTDGWLITHDEEIERGIDYRVFYNQLSIPLGDTNTVNPDAQALGLTSANEIRSNTYVGYDEFVAAIKAIQADAPDYVKIASIQVEDMGQGFCEFSAAVDVFAYDLIDRISAAPTNMNYMTWVGAENIATGGIVGLPSYFVVTNPDLYNVPQSSPLYGRYLALSSYDFEVNRCFAAWSHWGYEWKTLKAVLEENSSKPPFLAKLEVAYHIGAISTEEYNQQLAALTGQKPADEPASTPDD